MKRILPLVVFSLFFVSYCFAQDIQATSSITSVVVYPDSALINRNASLKLERGEHKIYFSDIIPDIDENSIKVSGKGTAQVKIFGAQLKREFLQKPYSEKIEQLQSKIQDLLDYIRSLQEKKEVLANERKFLESVRLFSGEQISKDLITKMPQVSNLEETAKFLSGKLNANYKRQLALDKEEREVNKKINVLQNELSQLTSQGNINLVKRSIVVELESEKAGTLDLGVSYLVRGVSWNMTYDARVAFKDKKVDLVSYGVVRQKTGDDWSDVNIALSTTRPSIGGRIPYISSWFLQPLSAATAVRRVQSVDYADELRLGKKQEKMAFLQYEAMAPSVTGGLEEEKVQDVSFSFAQSQQKSIAIVYNIGRKVTIKSDGSDNKLPISSQTLGSDFEYSACPRISPFAYLGSRVTNSKEMQLLAGRVNVFLDGDFVGASSLDNVSQGESFDLYLGVDQGVKIERKEVEKKVDETLFAGLSSPNKKIAFKYKITVENYKSDKIKLNLFEPMPVSQDDRIVVKMGKVSVQPTEKDWKDRKGVFKWGVALEPKEKKEINFDYVIEHPKDMQVLGL